MHDIFFFTALLSRLTIKRQLRVRRGPLFFQPAGVASSCYRAGLGVWDGGVTKGLSRRGSAPRKAAAHRGHPAQAGSSRWLESRGMRQAGNRAAITDLCGSVQG